MFERKAILVGIYWWPAQKRICAYRWMKRGSFLTGYEDLRPYRNTNLYMPTSSVNVLRNPLACYKFEAGAGRTPKL